MPPEPTREPDRAGAAPSSGPARVGAWPGIIALGAALALATLAWLGGFVPSEAVAPAVAGCALAGVCGFAGAWAKAWATGLPPADPKAPMMFRAALAGDFLLALLAIGAGALVLVWTGAKFVAIAGFGLAFAAAALVSQLVAAVAISRALGRRAVPSAESNHKLDPPRLQDSPS